VLLNIKKAEEHLRLKNEVTKLRRTLQEKETEILAVSPKTLEVLALARAIATSDAKSILLFGESGVGKDLFAKFIHQNSKRKDLPFLVLNCAAVPDNLIESELFGYEKGAFTDAKTQKKGLLELADNGTIFLDEIGDMKLDLQSKLLRVLEDGTFKRIGGTRDLKVDVRFIAATNQDLKKKIEEKLFREDLYYRLELFPLYIPPLRERKEDILPLAMHFVNFYNKKTGKKVSGFTEDAKNLLLNYSWPGNVRELKNTIERIIILTNKEFIDTEELLFLKKFDKTVPQETISSIEEMEINLINKALKEVSGNISKAAKKLGISRDKLRYRLKKYKILPEDFM
ncbi:MAG: sigma-54 dependent transcriptional regulator, partial [Thermoanaerobaculia bacterium]